MEREWTGNARRLSQADRLEIERRIRGGETFETAAAAVGCSTKSIQRYLALTGGLKGPFRGRPALRFSLSGPEGGSAGFGSGRPFRAFAARMGGDPPTVSRGGALDR